MYNQIWKKYLPFIRIQLKKSASGDQLMDLNRIDFERAGTGRKAGYKFNIVFNNGRIGNIISNSPLASNLAAVMLEDDATKAILKDNQFEISLNTKFQLTTKNLSPKAAAPETEASQQEDNTSEEQASSDEDSEDESKEERIERIRQKAEIVGTE
jgi:hypothetical protein